ncbi:MAG TPA: hypothetical protein VIL51_04040 [Thermoleophilia bacterium]
MEIGKDREPRLQVGGQEPFPISHAVVDRDVLQSRLRHITREDGMPVVLPVGSRVTLWSGPAVLFVGIVEEDQSVVDLLSAQPDPGEDFLDI